MTNVRSFCIGLGALALTACENAQQAAPAAEPAAKPDDLTWLLMNADKPETLLTLYACVLGLLWLFSVLFGGAGIMGGLADGIRYTGVLSMVAAPLYFVAFGNATTAIGVFVSGFIGVTTVTLLFFRRYFPEKKAPKTKKSPPAAAETAEN